LLCPTILSGFEGKGKVENDTWCELHRNIQTLIQQDEESKGDWETRRARCKEASL